jgi:hypothetical protein
MAKGKKINEKVLCKYAKKEYKENCRNLSLSNPTKTTNAIEKLERKNNCGVQPMTPRSGSKGFPSLKKEDFFGRYCRSRSPYFQSPQNDATIIGGKVTKQA